MGALQPWARGGSPWLHETVVKPDLSRSARVHLHCIHQGFLPPLREVSSSTARAPPTCSCLPCRPTIPPILSCRAFQSPRAAPWNSPGGYRSNYSRFRGLVHPSSQGGRGVCHVTVPVSETEDFLTCSWNSCCWISYFQYIRMWNPFSQPKNMLMAELQANAF